MVDFKSKVIKFISSVPSGKVVSYGQVAAACGSPRAARQVGGMLRSLDERNGIPWWRVVNNRGSITIKGNWFATKDMQVDLLRKEGVEIDKDLNLNIEKYRFRPSNI